MAVGLFHRQLTRDALSGFYGVNLKEILQRTEEVDIFFSHPKYSCHRVGMYQKEFEEYGGRRCFFPGAEEQAASFLEKALRGPYDRGENLGKLFHFILDALCPEHIFPFQENFMLLFFEPHFNFSLYAAIHYRDWSDSVKKEPITRISSPEDLRIKIIEAAEQVRGLPCSYRREDGIDVVDPRAGAVPLWGWNIPQEYVGSWVITAAGLIKGAMAFYVSKSR